MKNNLIYPIALLAALTFAPVVQAQRIAFVNTKYIMDNLPEYSSAQKELDRVSVQWQEEIDERHLGIKRMREAYNAEAILLTEEMKRGRMEEIDRREREARDLQKRRFGPGGDLFKKREELIKPIQDRVYDAIKEIAGTSYIAVFDIGGTSSNLLFASEKYDKSDSVLRKMGIRPGKEGTSGASDDEKFGDDPPEEEKPDPGKGSISPGGSKDEVKPR